MIFQGIWTSIAKNAYIFVIFQGGPDPLPPPLDPHDLRKNITCTDPEKGQGSGLTIKKIKNIGSISNTGPDPVKLIKLLSQYSMFGHLPHASKMLFKWNVAGRPMMAHL